jgi:hypothetical protein
MMNHWVEFTENDLKSAWDIHWHWEWLINKKWRMVDILKSAGFTDSETIRTSVNGKERLHNIFF